MPMARKRSFVPAPSGFGLLPFSSAVLAGEAVYLSGHIGVDPATGKVPQDTEQEARKMLDSFRGTLARAGLAMDDLVFVQIFCSDVSLFDKFNAVYRTYFSADFPARTFIGSGPLLFGARFEMQGIAMKRPPAVRRRRKPR